VSAVVADTHAAIWYLLNSPRLSAAARSAMETALQGGNPIYVASISLVEVTYLVEKGKVPDTALQRLEAALMQPQSGFVTAPLDLTVAQNLRHISRADVPDMPDRIIAATAHSLGLAVVTRDGKIRTSGVATIW